MHVYRDTCATAMTRLPQLKQHTPSIKLLLSEACSIEKKKSSGSLIPKRNSRCAAAGESRIETTLPHRVSTAHPSQKTLEADAVAPMGRCSVPMHMVSTSKKQHVRRVQELTSSDPCTNNKASDQCPLSRTQSSAPRNHPCAYFHPQFLRHRASSSPRSQSLSSHLDLSSCRML